MEVSSGAKTMIFFVLLLCTSNFEWELCVFNGSCTFVFWAWVRYVISPDTGNFKCIRKVMRTCATKITTEDYLGEAEKAELLRRLLGTNSLVKEEEEDRRRSWQRGYCVVEICEEGVM